jgi:RNA polymerase sigma-70 factor, ECF subfamily
MPYRWRHAATLYVEYGPVVYRRCVRILRDRELAHDAMQEVFLRLFRDASTFEDREKVIAWILRVARNYCINVRRDSRHVVLRGDDREREEGTRPDLAEALLARALLERFDPATQQAALSVLASGMSYREASAELRLSPSSVARKVNRFLTETRAYLTRGELMDARRRDAGAATPVERAQLAG